MWNKSKINKKSPQKSYLQGLSDSDIHSSSCEESDFSGSDFDAEL